MPERPFSRRLHLIVGILVLIGWCALILNLEGLAPKLGAYSAELGADVPLANAGTFRILTLPILSAACFLFPSMLSDWLSPRFKNSFDYVWDYRLWYFLGYLSLGVSVGLILLFR